MRMASASVGGSVTERLLAALLEQRRDPMVDAWTRVILEEPLDHYRQRPPELVREWIDRTYDAFVESLATGSSEPLERHGRRLGKERQRLGFKIEEVLDALLCGKQALVTVVVEELRDEPEKAIAIMTTFATLMRRIVCAFSAVFADTLRCQQQRVTALEERQRVARDLHDSVTQSLYAANMYGGAVSRLLDSGDTDRARAHLQELREATGQALREMRLLIFDLRTPDLLEQGLIAALEDRLAAVESRSGISAELLLVDPDAIPEGIAEPVFCIAREALNNVIKHSGASRVVVEVRVVDGRAQLSVRDNGTGFDVDSDRRQAGMGLTTMDERARAIGADLEIRSAPGGGTSVTVILPLTSLAVSGAGPCNKG